VEWVEVIVPVGAADIEDIAAMVVSELEAAQAGVEVRGDEVVFWVEAAALAPALAATRDAVTRWAATGALVDPGRVRSAEAMPESEWRDAWKRYFKVARLTRQFVVVPSWEAFTPEADDVVIDLDPGMAFGTGTHASTRLVLEEIQDLADREISPSRILDVGCGSGILAIACVKRWPHATCVALDNDPIAVDATVDNAVVNRVADRIAAGTQPLRELGGEQFPLVLANIQAHVLRELRAALIARVEVGGTLVLSGLLTPQAAPLAAEFVADGLRLVRIRPSTVDPQWSSALLSR
jgi:ribosomal protein L11 methyltransferase